MRSRLWLWTAVCLVVLVSTFFVAIRHSSQRENGRVSAGQPAHAAEHKSRDAQAKSSVENAQVTTPQKLASIEEVKAIRAARDKKKNKLEHRLSNTTASVDSLAKKDNAILLANALIDTEKPVSLS